ncbi:MAG: 23S rRNA (adenine(2503)-C(2))-methyltransferase RlmN [Oligoflexales bacterium]|nr:23S rRNA (adenine(2503)-C(2))-methyltransferase RlmN [Oligoflexales bacterium]
MSSASAHLLSFRLKDLENLCSDIGYSVHHAKTILRQTYKFHKTHFSELENFPQKLATHIQEKFSFELPEVVETQVSAYDNSVKFLLRLSDGGLIEAVLMPEKTRITLCVSSQFGCAQACSFCHTGRMGLIRNLYRHEIVAQVMIANKWIDVHVPWLKKLRLDPEKRVTNVVFMGMGEPLDNVDEVAAAIDILSEPFAYNLAARKITVSTAGHLAGLEKLLSLNKNFSLALSLHASSDKQRSKIMPINRRWPLSDLVEKLKFYNDLSGRDIFIQYTLIKGVNDSIHHAEEVAQLLKGLRVKINLIPLNPIDPSLLEAPEVEAIEFFRKILQNHGYRVMVRYSKGQDISAACGQLVSEASI